MSTPNDGTPAFRVDGLERRYGALQALAPLSLTIERGERVAIVGPSGAGKTTLLRLLSGSIEPSGGSIQALGRPLARLRPGRERAEAVGLLPQQFDLVPNLSVTHNVLAGNLSRWGLLRSTLSLIRPREVRRAEDALKRVGLADYLRERTSRLSGGEQQRVALARLLVQRPHALLADEPVASVDPARAEALLQLLVRMADEGAHTLIASLHSVGLALTHFERVLAFREGRLIFDRPSSTVTSSELDELYALEVDTAVAER